MANRDMARRKGRTAIGLTKRHCGGNHVLSYKDAQRNRNHCQNYFGVNVKLNT